MTTSNKERLKGFFSRFFGGDQVLVVINADPDAIAGAMTVKRLLWRKVAGVTFASVNVVKRPDNLAMLRLLDVQLMHVSEIEPEKFNRFVIVDSQPNHHEGFQPYRFDVVIDHHPLTDYEAPFMDVRPEYGATASIMTEYLRAADITPSAKLATGLFHAIKVDTCNFERKTIIQDIDAFQFLFQYTNIHLARKIEQADLRLDFLKYFAKGIENLRMRKKRVFIHLGTVTNADICVIVADFFNRIHSVQWTVISGLQDNKLVIIFRNDGLRKNAGTLAKNAFGAWGSAGGHQSMARAELPVENLEKIVDIDDEKALAGWIIAQIEKLSGKKNDQKFTKNGIGIVE